MLFRPWSRMLTEAVLYTLLHAQYLWLIIPHLECKTDRLQDRQTGSLNTS